MRVAVIGATGQLGTDLVAEFKSRAELLEITHRELDVRDPDSIQKALAPFRPNVVLNTAAFHKVDVCEDEPWNAVATNSLGTHNLALACRDLNAQLVHFSTDYVFSGEMGRPYREDDPAEPVNVYGSSKRAGELLALRCWPKTLVVRTSGLFGTAGASGKGGNFVETMIRLGRERGHVRVVADQVLSPTSTRDLASGIRELIGIEAAGIFHLTNSGYCSWFDFARGIFELAGLEVDTQPTSSAEFGARARRPGYSVLDSSRAMASGLSPMRPARGIGAIFAGPSRDMTLRWGGSLPGEGLFNDFKNDFYQAAYVRLTSTTPYARMAT
jgi:dTDP-4-dehydrorhamnose reductase